MCYSDLSNPKTQCLSSPAAGICGRSVTELTPSARPGAGAGALTGRVSEPALAELSQGAQVPHPPICQQGYPTTQLSSEQSSTRSSRLRTLTTLPALNRPEAASGRSQTPRCPGEGEAARKKGMLPVLESVLSLQPTKNSELALHPNPDVPGPRRTEDCNVLPSRRTAGAQLAGSRAEGGSLGRRVRKDSDAPLKEGWTLRHHPRGAPYRPCRPTAAPGRQLPGSRPLGVIGRAGPTPSEGAGVPPTAHVRPHARESELRRA